MTAQAADRRIKEETWAYRSYPMATGTTAFKNAIACLDTATGKITKGAVSTTLIPMGVFAEQVVNTSGADQPVVVQLFREIRVRWFKNDGTNPVTATDLGKNVYVVDDQTVSILATGRSVLGVAQAIDATLGVAVEVK